MQTKAYFCYPLAVAAILVLCCPESWASSSESSQRPPVGASPGGRASQSGASSIRRSQAVPAAGTQMPREGRGSQSGGVAGARTANVPAKAKEMKGNLSVPGQIKNEKKAYEGGAKSSAFGLHGGKVDNKGLRDMKDMPGGKALGNEAIGGDKGGKFNPPGRSGGGSSQGLGNNGEKKFGDPLGKKNDKTTGYGKGGGGKKGATGGFGTGDQGKKGSSGKKDTSSDKKGSSGEKDTSSDKKGSSGKKDTSGSKKDDSGKDSGTTNDNKEKDKKKSGSGGGVGPDPGVDGESGGNNDPLGVHPRRNGKRGNAPDPGAVGVDPGEGDRAGAGRSDGNPSERTNARINPGKTDNQHQTRQEGMNLIEKLGTYGVDPMNAGRQDGRQNAPPR